MPEVTTFKSGKDLDRRTRFDDQDTVSCVDCGAMEADQSAFENGWQLSPPVCPNCLRWVLTDDETCGTDMPS